MPPTNGACPFDSIESAYDLLTVLAETVFEEMKDLNRDQQLSVEQGEERRARAIELALFKLKLLSCYLYKGRRMLNDLRTLRRLILNERQGVEHVVSAPKALAAGGGR